MDQQQSILADYIPPDELAEQLGVTTRTLHHWRAIGEGPARTKIGKKILYHRQDVAAWLQTCREG